jgi:intracellular sulfur oxidation DsrE/DsrF family protein
MVTNFVNSSEQDKIDIVVKNLQNHLSNLDSEVTELVRNQASANIEADQMVEHIQKDIKDIINKLIAIKKKASHSKDLVAEMTNGNYGMI